MILLQFIVVLPAFSSACTDMHIKSHEYIEAYYICLRNIEEKSMLFTALVNKG